MNEYYLLYYIVVILGIGTILLTYIKNKSNVWYSLLILISILGLIRIFEKNSEIENLIYLNSQYSSNIKKLHTKIDELETEISDLNNDMAFYNKYIVFVNSGVNVYHSLDCENFDSSSFLAFNVENAFGQGYKPCSKCDAPVAKGAEKTYIVYITTTGSKYHLKGCSYLKSSITISKDDAISKGYTACSRCNP